MSVSHTRGAWLLVLVLGCDADGGRASDTVMRDSAGVRTAATPGMDRPLHWTLTETFRLGGAEEGPGSFTVAGPNNVGTDASGRIHVLDSHQFRVEVFAPDGRHLRFLGRQGGGPGELEFPGFVAVDPSGVVGVYDYVKRALVRWGPDGAILPLLRVEGFWNRLAIRGDTVVFVRDQRDEQSPTSRSLQVRIATPQDSVDLPGIESPLAGPVTFACITLNSPPLFSRSTVYDVAGDQIAVTHQVPYQVDVYRGARLVRSIRRAIAAETPALRHVERLFPTGMKVSFSGGRSCIVPAAEVMAKQGVAAQLPLIRAVAFDPAGRLWVERYTFDDEAARLDLFDAEGRYLGTLAGKRLPLGFVGPDIGLFPEENPDTGVEQVVAYRIAR